MRPGRLSAFLTLGCNMASTIARFDSLATYGVLDFVLGGTWETTDIITMTIGNKVVTQIVGSTTISTIIDTLVTTWNDLSTTRYPEAKKITASRSGSTLRFTHDELDTRFAITLATTETGGGAADAQTIDGGTTSTGTFSTASAGPRHWSATDNWTLSALPANTNDLYIENHSTSFKFGLAQSTVTLNSLNIPASYTGDIGLPRTHEDGFYEYLDTYLAISATTAKIGYGEGQGSQRIKWNSGTNVTTINVYSTGQPVEDGIPAFLWKGVHASNVLNLQKGSVGVAFFATETATLPTIRTGFVDNQAADVDLWCGSGATLTTIDQNGGKITVNSAVTTWTMSEGSAVVREAATVTTFVTRSINGSAPKITYNSSGTITALTLGHGCIWDGSADLRSMTITTLTMYKGAKLICGHRTMTFTNSIILKGCGIEDVTIDTVSDFTVDSYG